MSLVPSLLQAIVHLDGEALVMHAGDKPYVVSPMGQVDLATRGLALDAINGILNQLLPQELQQALDEFGAVQYDLPPMPEFMGEHFTVVAARGGDDVWVEVRRHRIADEDRIPETFFTPPEEAAKAQPYPVYASVGSPDLPPPAALQDDALDVNEAVRDIEGFQVPRREPAQPVVMPPPAPEPVVVQPPVVAEVPAPVFVAPPAPEPVEVPDLVLVAPEPKPVALPEPVLVAVPEPEPVEIPQPVLFTPRELEPAATLEPAVAAPPVPEPVLASPPEPVVPMEMPPIVVVVPPPASYAQEAMARQAPADAFEEVEIDLSGPSSEWDAAETSLEETVAAIVPPLEPAVAEPEIPPVAAQVEAPPAFAVYAEAVEPPVPEAPVVMEIAMMAPDLTPAIAPVAETVDAPVLYEAPPVVTEPAVVAEMPVLDLTADITLVAESAAPVLVVYDAPEAESGVTIVASETAYESAAEVISQPVPELVASTPIATADVAPPIEAAVQETMAVAPPDREQVEAVAQVPLADVIPQVPLPDDVELFATAPRPVMATAPVLEPESIVFAQVPTAELEAEIATPVVAEVDVPVMAAPEPVAVAEAPEPIVVAEAQERVVVAEASTPEPEPIVVVAEAPALDVVAPIVSEVEEPVVVVPEPVAVAEAPAPESEPVVVAEASAEPEPVVVAVAEAPALDVAEPMVSEVAEPVMIAPEPEPVVVAEAPTAEPQPVVAVAEAPALEVEPPMVSEVPEPVMIAELEPEPVVVAEAPAPEPEPVVAAAETPIVSEVPEPVMIAEPEPEPVVVAEAPALEPEPVLVAEAPPLDVEAPVVSEVEEPVMVAEAAPELEAVAFAEAPAFEPAVVAEAPTPEPMFVAEEPMLEVVPPIVSELEEAAMLAEADLEAEPVAAADEWTFDVEAPIVSEVELPEAVAEAPWMPEPAVMTHHAAPELEPVVMAYVAAPEFEEPVQSVAETDTSDVEEYSAPAAVFATPVARPFAAQPRVVLPLARNPIRSEQPPLPYVGDPTMSGLDRLLRLSAARGASTLYLSSESRASVRVDGELQLLDGEPILTSRDVESLLLTLMPERNHEALRTGAATEWICDIEDVGRVRCMSFRDHLGPGGVFRLMPIRSVSAEQLGLPRSVQNLASEPEGLVLVAGPRSSGKRTLISAFVDLINRTRRDHVITIEREINIVHGQGASFISQREIRGSDDDVLTAARAALREDPDVLVIEDVRTPGLMNVALEAAASGHLVVAGFSAHTATAAVDRIIDLYAPEHRRQVQFALADSLRGVVVQVLLRKQGGGRVAARELLLNTPAVSSVIAEGKTSQLPMAIEGGRRYGMMPLNDALVGLVQHGTVDGREAYRYASDRPGLLALLKRQGVDTSFVEKLA